MIGDAVSIPLAAGLSLLGFSIVFIALISLWIVIAILAKVLGAAQNGAKAAPAAAAPVAAAAPARELPPAPGTAGELMLHDVQPRDAALVMAIVANKLGKPMNELRFKSIKEVK